MQEGSLLDHALKEGEETGGGERLRGAGGRKMNVVCVSTCSRASRRGDLGQGCVFLFWVCLVFFFVILVTILILSAGKIKEHWNYILDRACSYAIIGYFLINSLVFYSKSTVTQRASGKVRTAQASAFILQNKYTRVPCIFKTGSRVDLEEFLSLRILRILNSIRLGPRCSLSKTSPFSLI